MFYPSQHIVQIDLYYSYPVFSLLAWVLFLFFYIFIYRREIDMDIWIYIEKESYRDKER